jgi:hypothetical protein
MCGLYGDVAALIGYDDVEFTIETTTVEKMIIIDYLLYTDT